MGTDCETSRGGERADPRDLADAAAPLRVRFQDIDGAGFHELIKLPAIVVMLAGGDRDRRHLPQAGERFNLAVRLEWFLQPAGSQWFHRLAPSHAVGEIPSRQAVDHDVVVFAADFAEGLHHGYVELEARGPVPRSQRGEPFLAFESRLLHPRGALRDRVDRADRHPDGRRIAVHNLPRTAEQSVHRQIAEFPLHVPQGVRDCADAEHVGSGVPVISRDQAFPHAVNRERIHADDTSDLDHLLDHILVEEVVKVRGVVGMDPFAIDSVWESLVTGNNRYTGTYMFGVSAITNT